MSINVKDIICIKKKVIQKEHNDTLYLVDPKTETIHTLNETASCIWKYIQKPKSVLNIIQMVTTTYNVSRLQATRDVINFLEIYLDRNLLEKNPVSTLSTE